jgi:N-acetylglucosaminyldiphosphoundecaprenol N-acetyl-beta-D-mannosaminyltransferase
MTSIAPPEQAVWFLDVRFDKRNEEEALRAVVGLANDDAFSFVVTPNVDHLVRLQDATSDELLWSSYREASLSLCDSRILAALARLAGIKLKVVPGSDLTARILAADQHFRRVAVIGGSDELMRKLSRRFPQFEWYHHSPPRRVLHNTAAQQDIIQFVEDCPAEITFFAIGSPQSELLCSRLANRKRARGVALCVGASLEFLTGSKRRAPVWMQRRGLEWLFRLMSEPRRLWRRYLLEGPRILVIWWRWRFSPRR